MAATRMVTPQLHKIHHHHAGQLHLILLAFSLILLMQDMGVDASMDSKVGSHVAQAIKQTSCARSQSSSLLFASQKNDQFSSLWTSNRRLPQQFQSFQGEPWTALRGGSADEEQGDIEQYATDDTSASTTIEMQNTENPSATKVRVEEKIEAVSTTEFVNGRSDETTNRNSVPAEPVTTTSVTASATTTASTIQSKKLANFQERLIPALGMLAFVGALAYWGKEDGLILLTLLLLQPCMYTETCHVIGGAMPQFLKWYWFVTMSVAWNGPQMFPWARLKLATISTSMTIAGIVGIIGQLHRTKATSDDFRDILRRAAVSFLSAVLVVLPSSYWIATMENFGQKWMAIPALLIIINDTMAYVFGVLFGKHKILPTISPSKTWEGFLGAALSTILASYFFLNSRQEVFFFGLSISLVAPFGGFLASTIKRAYQQKDFGTIFPGHGGFVDRLDCQLIMGPLVYLYLKWNVPSM